MKHLLRCGILVAIVLASVGSASAEEVLRYAGATTLQRFFMPEMARVFTSDTAIKVHIEGGNTGPGIAALLKGEVDMAGAGRRLSEAERKQGLVEHFLGWDVLSVVVHKQNPLDNISLEDLRRVFSGDITDWQELGGKSAQILVVSCPQGSGMRSAVQNLILKEKPYLAREVVSGIVAEADQQVGMFPVGITVTSNSMLDAENVKAISVDGVSATAANVAGGLYPLAKPLALVTRGEPQGDLARFVDLVKSEQGRAVLQDSFIAAQ